MKLSRSFSQAMFLIAGFAIMGFAWLWPSGRQPEIIPSKQVEVRVEKSEILVAKQQLEPGHQLSESEAEWIELSTDTHEAGALIRANKVDVPIPYLGRVIVGQIKSGEPILPRHFLAADGNNYIAGLLSPGKRAFAIVINSKGTESAGNFILPNDRVDVIRSSNASAGLTSELILSDIRVLAIGANVRGEGLSASGETATVEVNVREAEILATAQRAGQISLALRRPDEQSDPVSTPTHLIIIRPSSHAEKSP